ncbi:hypothetical protein ACLB2K_038068 [Fragaria x ananassa]
MRNNMPSAAKVLQQNPKFKSLFDQLEYGPEARYAAAKGLMDVTETFGPQCFAAGIETQRGRSLLEGDNAIVFTDKDIEVDYLDHRRPLYLEAQVNNVLMRRALVDTGSSLNIISLQVLIAAGISLAKIVKTSMSISEFANGSEEAVSCILLNLKVGPIQSLTKFYVVEVNLSDDPTMQKNVSISSHLTYEERSCLISLLEEYKDVFAWSYKEMPGLDPNLVCHTLTVQLGARPVVQSKRNYHPDDEQ